MPSTPTSSAKRPVLWRLPPPPRPGWQLVIAADLEPGDCFVKRTAGASGFAHLVLDPGGFRRAGLAAQGDGVYGVSFHGHLARLELATLVWRVPPGQMAVNRAAEAAWDAMFARTQEPEEGGSRQDPSGA